MSNLTKLKKSAKEMRQKIKRYENSKNALPIQIKKLESAQRRCRKIIKEKQMLYKKKGKRAFRKSKK